MTRFALLALAALYPLLASAQGNGENGGIDDQDGASGSSPGSWNLSHGGLIAIIVIVTVIGVFGITSAVLFYVAKKRQWEIRASIRRASRKMASQVSLRSPLPRQSSRHGTVTVQPTKEERTRDLEKGQPRTSTREMREHRSGDERRQDPRRETQRETRHQSSQQPRSSQQQQSSRQHQSTQQPKSEPRPQSKPQPKQDPLQFPQEEPVAKSKWERLMPGSWSVGRKGADTSAQ